MPLRSLLAVMPVLMVVTLNDGFTRAAPTLLAGLLGQTLTLDCPLVTNDKTGEVVEWKDKIFSQLAGPIDIFTSKDNPNRTINWAHSQKKQYKVTEDFKLQIMPNSFDFRGKYLCVVTDEDGEAKTYVYDVTFADTVQCSNISSSVKLGDTLDLECYFEHSGSLPPNAFWIGKMGNRLSSTTAGSHSGSNQKFNQILSLAGITRNMHGEVYTCIAGYPEYNTTDNCSIAINIKGGPTFDLEKEQTKYNLKVGETLKITCAPLGEPAPEVTWFHNHNIQVYESLNVIPLSDNETFKIQQVGRQSMLQITLSERDLDWGCGIYQCKASNENGEMILDIEVIKPKNGIGGRGITLDATTSLFALVVWFTVYTAPWMKAAPHTFALSMFAPVH